MNGFDKRFKKAQDDLDRDFNRVKKYGIIAGIFALLLSLGLIGFGIWVGLLLCYYNFLG